ncbi:MAG: Malate/L-lactate dehydrogenase [Sediminibacterium sp.]|nr:Malate/L-lactate dehydrogenase [Sediminibacterium sp.]
MENTGIIIPKEEMQERFTAILLKEGFSNEKALRCAEIFTMNSIDGVYTHGVNRFPRFVKYIKDGFVQKDAEPTLQHAFGSIEQWNGNLGPGTLNAEHATSSAMRLARAHGMGCVALSNTNHWMRAGAYAWQAAKAGFIFIGWTNTISNMPAWGAVDARVGNNPLVMALPHGDEAIVLDMAMSQYSLGHMELSAMRNELLPVNGGFNKEGVLTNDPAAILVTRRLLPTGYWKGSGLALLLDLLATILSGGLSTAEISKKNVEYGLSQVFIAIDISKLNNHSSIAAVVENIINDYHGSVPIDGSKKVTYPGERVLQTRKKNLANGIPVQQNVWNIIMDLYNGTTDFANTKYT